MPGTAPTQSISPPGDWLAIALQTAHVAVGVVRLADHRFVQVNPAFTRLLGYARDEVIGRSATELGLWPDPDQRARLIQWLEHGGSVTGLEADLRSKSGAMVHIAMSARIVRIHGERHYIGFLTDASERKRLESALQGPEDRLRMLFAATHTVAFHQDPDLRYTWVASPALGVSERDLVGRTDEEILGAEAAAPLVAIKCRVLQTGEAAREEVFVKRAGEAGWFDLTVQPERDVDGRVTGLLCAATDITARKAAGATREIGSIKFEALLASLHDCAFVVDTAGRLVDFNDAFLRFHRIADRAECPRFFADYAGLLEIRADDGGELPLPQWPVPRALRGESAHDAEYTVCRKDTGATWIGAYSFAPLVAADGTLLGAVVTARDVSEQKAQARRLAVLQAGPEQSDFETAGATRAKAAFLANISHEIRTPLNAINGMAALLRREGLTGRQAERLNKLEMASAQLLKVVQDLLDVAQIEAGELALEPASLRIGSIIADTAAQIYLNAVAKGLNVATAVGPVPGGLVGDARRIQQALLNYASNAVKFSESGTIEIRARMVEEGPDFARVRFEVADTGIGIAPDVMQRLFTPFEQGDNSKRRRHGGTGLGLSITRRLATLMGGDAGAESKLGAGSTFWFTVRLAKQPAFTAVVPAFAGDRLERRLRRLYGGTPVLVIDGDASRRAETCDLLRFAGLVAHEAGDDTEAAVLMDARPYDLFLMDLNPTEESVDRVRAVRRAAGRGAPILGMTAGSFNSADRAALLDAGIDDFVVRPVQGERLYGKLLEWLSGGASANPPAQA